MQGVESTARPNGAWAPINASSPSVEVEERPRYNHGPYPYGMPYQNSPNQSSTAPSLISASNADSTSGLNSPYVNNQIPYGSSQPPHVASFPSIAQHTMAPPHPQTEIPDEIVYQKWIGDKESIRMNAGFDNFQQTIAMDSWPLQPDGMQNPNFIQAAWAVPVGTTW